MKTTFKLFGLMGIAIIVAGCHTDMWVQPKLRSQHESDFFPDKMVNRMPITGTVARGHERTDDAFYKGRVNGKLVTEIPLAKAMAELKVTDMKGFLARGRERFTIYCTPCHGQVGDGNGMITQRGLALKKKPGNYHTDRLRKMPIGHFYDVMTNGFGIMYSYASRVEPADRWAIAAYIRALQLSQHADPNSLNSEDMKKIEEAQAAGGSR
ncbi:MAG: cytochrome c [Fimbriimonadales bacterium]